MTVHHKPNARDRCTLGSKLRILLNRSSRGLAPSTDSSKTRCVLWENTARTSSFLILRSFAANDSQFPAKAWNSNGTPHFFANPSSLRPFSCNFLRGSSPGYGKSIPATAEEKLQKNESFRTNALAIAQHNLNVIEYVTVGSTHQTPFASKAESSYSERFR